MKREDLERIVAAHPFLLGLSEHHIRLIADCAIRTHFETGQVIFRDGETANRFYLIEQGKIALESSASGGDPVTIDVVGDGDLLGWSWLFPPYRWHFGAVATSTTHTLTFNGPLVRALCQRDPALGFELTGRFLRVMGERLQSARQRLQECQRAAGHHNDL